MTKTQLKQKVQKMFDEIDVQKCVDKVIDSGCVDINKWDDDFRLPKIVLSASLKELAFQYEPVDKSDKNEVSNISLFL